MPNEGGFTNADIFLREEQEHAYAKEDWWHRERLYKPDYAVIQWRMMVHKHTRGIQNRGDFAPLDEEPEGPPAFDEVNFLRGNPEQSGAPAGQPPRPAPDGVRIQGSILDTNG